MGFSVDSKTYQHKLINHIVLQKGLFPLSYLSHLSQTQNIDS